MPISLTQLLLLSGCLCDCPFSTRVWQGQGQRDSNSNYKEREYQGKAVADRDAKKRGVECKKTVSLGRRKGEWKRWIMDCQAGRGIL